MDICTTSPCLMNKRESCEISVSKTSTYLEEDIPVINHGTDHIDRSNIVVNPQSCFPGFPLGKFPLLQESRSKHQGQIGGSHSVARNLGKREQKVVDSEVVMKVIQMKVYFILISLLPLSLWLCLSCTLTHFPGHNPHYPFPGLFTSCPSMPMESSQFSVILCRAFSRRSRVSLWQGGIR